MSLFLKAPRVFEHKELLLIVLLMCLPPKLCKSRMFDDFWRETKPEVPVAIDSGQNQAGPSNNARYTVSHHRVRRRPGFP
jgi:hypothetical protein